MDRIRRKLHGSNLPPYDTQDHVVVTVYSILDQYLEVVYSYYLLGTEGPPTYFNQLMACGYAVWGSRLLMRIITPVDVTTSKSHRYVDTIDASVIAAADGAKEHQNATPANDATSALPNTSIQANGF